jgi:hypothetical protein
MISSNQVFTKNNKLIVGELPSTTYNVMDVDDILNVNTSVAPVDIYLPNIKNSSILIQNRVISINDVGGSASKNNIRIYTTGSDSVNSSSVLILNQDGANVILQASNNSEWVGTGVPITTYKVYTALLSQKGINPPIAIVLENTIGDIVWSYSSIGEYIGTLVNAFTDDKTYLFAYIVPSSLIKFERNNVSQVSIGTTDNLGAKTNGLLDNTSIEIRVYS